MKINKKTSFIFLGVILIFGITINSQFISDSKFLPLTTIISFRRQHNNPFISFSVPSPNIQTDNAGQASTININGTTVSISNFVIGNGNNRILIANLISSNSSISNISVSYGSQALTLLTSYNPGTPILINYIYYLINPTISSTTSLTASWTGNSQVSIIGTSYFNVNQTSPFGTISTTNQIVSSSQIYITYNVTIATSWILNFTGSNNGVNNLFSAPSPNVLDIQIINTGFGMGNCTCHFPATSIGNINTIVNFIQSVQDNSMISVEMFKA